MAVFTLPPTTPIEERWERRTTARPRLSQGQETVVRGQEWLHRWEARIAQINEREIAEEAALQEYRAPENPRRRVAVAATRVGRRAAPDAPSPFDEDDAE